jgi:hypothetical protein
MKNDKQIHPGEMPANSDAPSAFQPPHKPGYDVIDPGRGPGAIKHVGEMTYPMYPGELDGNVMGVDLSMEATNRIGRPDGRTTSDPSGVEPITFQHPAKAERIMAGDTRDSEPTSVPMTGCGSDEMMDQHPESRRGKHDNLPKDQE